MVTNYDLDHLPARHEGPLYAAIHNALYRFPTERRGQCRLVRYQSVGDTIVQLFRFLVSGVIASSHPIQPGALIKSSSERERAMTQVELARESAVRHPARRNGIQAKLASRHNNQAFLELVFESHVEYMVREQNGQELPQ